jgi:hypothetical protein
MQIARATVKQARRRPSFLGIRILASSETNHLFASLTYKAPQKTREENTDVQYPIGAIGHAQR